MFCVFAIKKLMEEILFFFVKVLHILLCFRISYHKFFVFIFLCCSRSRLSDLLSALAAIEDSAESLGQHGRQRPPPVV